MSDERKPKPEPGLSRVQTLRRPVATASAVDWQIALENLVIHGICPWCDRPISEPRVLEASGLTWSCNDGCNP